MTDALLQLKPGERVDDLQRGGYRMIQDPARFCFGMDAVLLAAFAMLRPGEHVLDLGTGSGILPLLLHARSGRCSCTGLEIDGALCDMARRSVRLNGLEDDIAIVRGDIRGAAGIFPAASFGVVVSNPPYMRPGHGLENANISVAAARHEIWCTLEDVAKAARHCLGSGGRFYLVHRPFRLVEIFRTLTDHHLEPKRMRLVYPYVNKEPNLVLIEARKGARSRLLTEPPLVVYQEPGIYTPEVMDIYYGDGDDRDRKSRRDSLSLCDPHRQSGGYDTAGGADLEGGGSDRGGGYPQQHPSAQLF